LKIKSLQFFAHFGRYGRRIQQGGSVTMRWNDSPPAVIVKDGQTVYVVPYSLCVIETDEAFFEQPLRPAPPPAPTRKIRIPKGRNNEDK
jgi:hypothetical protein